MIYFIQAADGGDIKIGTTVRLSTRLDQLETKYDCEFRVLAVIDGGRVEEKGLHGRFSHLNTTGEWFSPSPELLAFIEAEGRPWEPTEEPRLASIPIQRRLAGMLKMIAEHRRSDPATVFTEMIREPVDKAYAQMLREIEAK